MRKYILLLCLLFPSLSVAQGSWVSKGSESGNFCRNGDLMTKCNAGTTAYRWAYASGNTNICYVSCFEGGDVNDWCESENGPGYAWNQDSMECEAESNECDLSSATAANEPLQTQDTYTSVRGDYATSIKTGELKTIHCSHFCEVHKTLFTSVTRIGADNYTIVVTGSAAVNATLCESPPSGGYDFRKNTIIPGRNDLYGSMDPPAGGCPQGTVYGQINGEDKCVISSGGDATGSGDNGSGGSNNQSADTDGNGIPDVDDDDIDGDGEPNATDQTPYGPGGNYGNEANEFEGDDTSDFYDDEGAKTGEGDELTYSNVFANFQTRMNEAPVIQGIDSFFTLSISGSCPSYSVSAWVFDITFNQWCSSIMPWALISGVILALATFIAVRIAFT